MQDEDKRAAAVAAADEVAAGMLVGLGTGSTAAFLIDELGRRHAAGLAFRAVATSLASERQAAALGIPVLRFEDVAQVDLTIDGADEIDPALRAIKGAGGAMLREKIVATASARMVVIADGSKRVDQLGGVPVPVELLPFARSFVTAAVERLGAAPQLRPGAGGQPYLTDNGNLILDCRFGPIADPDGLAAALAAIPGVVGHGLFVREVATLYLARQGEVARFDRAEPGKADPLRAADFLTIPCNI